VAPHAHVQGVWALRALTGVQVAVEVRVAEGEGRESRGETTFEWVMRGQVDLRPGGWLLPTGVAQGGISPSERAGLTTCHGAHVLGVQANFLENLVSLLEQSEKAAAEAERAACEGRSQGFSTRPPALATNRGLDDHQAAQNLACYGLTKKDGCVSRARWRRTGDGAISFWRPHQCGAL